MKVNTQADRVIVRNGKVSLGPGQDCCCCTCTDSEVLANDCGIDYIAVDLELCFESCFKVNPGEWPGDGPNRSCPGDSWTTTIEIRSAYGFRCAGYLDSNAPPGQNDLLAFIPDGGEIDPDNPIEIPQFSIFFYASLACGSESVDIGFGTSNLPAIVPDSSLYYLVFGILVKQPIAINTNCFSSDNYLISYPSFCAQEIGPGGDAYQLYYMPVGSVRSGSLCCPQDPGGILSADLSLSDCAGSIFKVKAVTIVYL